MGTEAALATAADPAAPTLQQALDDYRGLFLTARNLAVRSRREYTDDLTQLVHFLAGQCGLSSPFQVEHTHLDAFLAFLDVKGYAAATRRRKLASTKSFFLFLEQQGRIARNPTTTLSPPSRDRLQPRVLTEAEYKRLQLAVAHQVRDAAIIELLLQTGMRLSELCRLTLAQVELPAKISRDDGHVGAVRIFGKGRKDRTVTLNWKACRAVKAYLQVRPRLEDEPHLFLSKFKSPLGPRAVQYLVEKYLAEAGISGASVHTLRHTFATQMVKKGTKLDVVRQALGHEDLKTTSIYVQLARELMDKELQQNAL